jgi:hypothetical protein
VRRKAKSLWKLQLFIQSMFLAQVLAAEFPWLSFESLPEIWWYSPAEFPNDALKEEFHSTEPMG